MAVGIIAWAIIETWPWLLLAWAVALLIAGVVLGLATVLEDWMNGVLPGGRREPMRGRRMAIPSDVLLGALSCAVAELRCGQARNGFAALGAARS
jgi:hypothetical protein